MAKKSKIDINELIKSEFGDIIVSGSEILNNEEEKFDLSPSLNIALGGGIPLGCTVITAAKQKYGKTTAALYAAKKFLEKFEQGSVWHIDVESRVRQRQIHGIEGLSKYKDRYHSTLPMDIDKKTGAPKLFTAERYLELVKTILLNNPYSFIILDSISALCPETEMIESPSGDLRPKAPKLVSNFLKQTTGLVRHNKCTLWSIHMLYQNTSGYGAGWLPDGGSKIMYLSDVFLMQSHPAKKIEYWPDEANPLGQVASWSIPFTALNAPGRTATSYIRYGYGIDEVREVLELAVSVAIIHKGGAWFKYDSFNWQGIDKAYEALSQDKDLYNEIYDKVKELFCTTKTTKEPSENGELSPEIQELLQEVT